MSTERPVIQLGSETSRSEPFVAEADDPIEVYVDDIICASIRSIGDEVLVELWPRTPDVPDGSDGGTHLLVRDIDKVVNHFEGPRALQVTQMLSAGFDELRREGCADSDERRAELVERAWKMLGIAC